MKTEPFAIEPIFEVSSPVSTDMPTESLDGRFTLQVSQPLTTGDFGQLAQLAERFPSMRLRVYQAAEHAPVTDLEFLQMLPRLRRFQVDVYGLRSLDGLRHLDSPASLRLGRTGASLSLDVLGGFTRLSELSLEGHTTGIDVLKQLRSLEHLTLRSVTLSDLSTIADLPRLWWLAIKLGGTRDLAVPHHFRSSTWRCGRCAACKISRSSRSSASCNICSCNRSIASKRCRRSLRLPSYAASTSRHCHRCTIFRR